MKIWKIFFAKECFLILVCGNPDYALLPVECVDDQRDLHRLLKKTCSSCSYHHYCRLCDGSPAVQILGNHFSIINTDFINANQNQKVLIPKVFYTSLTESVLTTAIICWFLTWLHPLVHKLPFWNHAFDILAMSNLFFCQKWQYLDQRMELGRIILTGSDWEPEEHFIVETSQSQGNYAKKHKMIYHQVFRKWDHN